MGCGSSWRRNEPAEAAFLGGDAWIAAPPSERLACNGGATNLGQAGTPLSFHPEALGAVQKRDLRQLGPLMTQRQFYLGGRTALAIYFGHRRSVDFDWFTGGGSRIPCAWLRKFAMRRFSSGQARWNEVHFMELCLACGLVFWSIVIRCSVRPFCGRTSDAVSLR